MKRSLESPALEGLGEWLKEYSGVGPIGFLESEIYYCFISNNLGVASNKATNMIPI